MSAALSVNDGLASKADAALEKHKREKLGVMESGDKRQYVWKNAARKDDKVTKDFLGPRSETRHACAAQNERGVKIFRTIFEVEAC